jgi:methylmalonyl-CoA mutase cobalamin-binding domain/chain
MALSIETFSNATGGNAFFKAVTHPLAGAHMMIAREAIALLNARGAGDVRLVMGGIIPEADRARLVELGVRAVFTPKDSNLGAIIERIIAIGEERDTAA